jgi:hypothetical protein
VNQLDTLLISAGEAIGSIIARYAAELQSIEAWLDWGYDYEPYADTRPRAALLTALLKNLYVVTNVLHLQRTRFSKALMQAQRGADRLGEANVLQSLGNLALAEGVPSAMHRSIGERLGQAFNLDDQANALWELTLQQAALGAWWQAHALARELGLSMAAKLDGIFAQIEQNLGEEGYQMLLTELHTHAEAWRQEAIETLRRGQETPQAQG